jgi:hypothetical protein
MKVPITTVVPQEFVTRGRVSLYSATRIFHVAIVRIRRRMLDLYGIVLTSVIVLMVIVRALQADRIEPWFTAIRRKATQPGAGYQFRQPRG